MEAWAREERDRNGTVKGVDDEPAAAAAAGGCAAPGGGGLFDKVRKTLFTDKDKDAGAGDKAK